MQKGIIYALLAAITFGASTPFAKILVGQIAPVMLAALLYLGSGIGLFVWLFARRLFFSSQRDTSASLRATDIPWLGGAIVFGGVAGPVLLLLGLTLTPASSASLLLNIEGVLTALLAWLVFKENVGRRIVLGMVLIVAGGCVLAWEQQPVFDVPLGPLAIFAACLCWAIDNNLTRKASASDAVQISAVKGLVAGIVNGSIALFLGLAIPSASIATVAGVVGFVGYGFSLVLFVLALRNLGTARTAAYFSVAPFVGAGIALLMLDEASHITFWLSGALMAVGVWLHLTEKHLHRHTHRAMAHAHLHKHDTHHQHEHDFLCETGSAHVHVHRHDPATHVHAHYPDIHHRHRHKA